MDSKMWDDFELAPLQLTCYVYGLQASRHQPTGRQLGFEANGTDLRRCCLARAYCVGAVRLMPRFCPHTFDRLHVEVEHELGKLIASVRVFASTR